MKNNRVLLRGKFRKIYLLLGVGIILILVFLEVLLNPAYSASAETLSFVEPFVTQQADVENNVLKYYKAGVYTFVSPLVIQNPYRTAPLTALLIFNTTQNAQISIHVPGRTPEANVDFSFAGYQTYHEIPVYGLYAGTNNLVVLSMKLENGESQQTVINLQTEPLPVYLDEIKIDSVDRSKYSSGFNFTFLLYKTIFDIDGAVRWYSTQETFDVFTRLQNGRYLYTNWADPHGIIFEKDLLGKIYAIYNVDNGIHHDIYELPNGNLLVTSADLKSDAMEDFLVEIDRGTDHIVHSFDLKNYLDHSRPKEINAPVNDWLHLNSIVYDATDSSIIISSRSQSAVVKMSYPEMKIQWILGPHDNWSEKFQPYLLTPVGKEFDWSWSQHHATLYGPDLPGDGVVDIGLFDDGLYRSFDPALAFSAADSFSRVVHYRINEAEKTVEQIWEYGKARGNEIFSNTLGSAYLLSNGNVLGTWGDIGKDVRGNPVSVDVKDGIIETKIIEVDPSSSAVVFESTLPVANYRTFRAGLYDGYSEGSSFLSTPLNDASGHDLVFRSQMFWKDATSWLNQQVLALKLFIHKVLGSI